MTGTILTTALPITGIAPDATPITTGSSPLTAELGPRLYRVTTGGTGGEEEIKLPTPDVPIGGFLNDTLIGLRITITLDVQTDPADVIKITPASGSLYMFLPQIMSSTALDSVVLQYSGGVASFVWAGDAWLFDSASTDGNCHYGYPAGTGSGLVFGDAAARTADGNGVGSGLVGGSANTQGVGGDVHLTPGNGAGTGRHGLIICDYAPTADPHVAGAVWSNAGVLTISAG